MIDESNNFRRRKSERIKIIQNRVRRQCTVKGIFKIISSFIPIFKWLPEYNWNECFFHDMSGGLSMAVLAVPTGIAHAGIAGVEPVYGLYTAIFPAFLYMIFGHSRYTALGKNIVLRFKKIKGVE
uniref:SLC26A/SulP transporter domain-containing protein n=1 Tax=Panagrolaimus davidi TaxID=227884 RepID=A0A914QFM9_9BILA